MIKLGSDNIRMREYIYSLLDLSNAKAILDIGCGYGYDLWRIGQIVGDNTRLVGIDVSSKAIEHAISDTKDDSRYSFSVVDLSSWLPFERETFDIVFSNNFLECITDKDSLVKEIHRVLRQNGQVVFAHFDWDSQLINGSDKTTIQKIVQTFNNWKQDWMADCDAWMGRRLWGIFNRSGLFKGNIYTYVLTNTEFTPECYGYCRIKDMEALIRHGMIQKEEYERFYKDIKELADKGEYFYSITMYIYVGRKVRFDKERETL